MKNRNNKRLQSEGISSITGDIGWVMHIMKEVILQFIVSTKLHLFIFEIYCEFKLKLF